MNAHHTSKLINFLASRVSFLRCYPPRSQGQVRRARKDHSSTWQLAPIQKTKRIIRSRGWRCYLDTHNAITVRCPVQGGQGGESSTIWGVRSGEWRLERFHHGDQLSDHTVRKKEGSVQINVRGGVPTALLFTWRSLSHSFLFFLIIDTRLD